MVFYVITNFTTINHKRTIFEIIRSYKQTRLDKYIIIITIT